MIEPLVSVKMITYNHAPYIAQAIEGVLQQQTDFPLELVIGEDCSTDGTREIVFEYGRRYPDIIRIIASTQNLGAIANSRQTGEACKGKYIAFCEGDDYWHNPRKLQRQVDCLEDHPECGLVYSDFDVYHPRPNRTIKGFIRYKGWEIPKNPTVADFVAPNGILGQGIATCTVVLRRALYEEVKSADPYLHLSGHFLMGDTQLWAEMSNVTRLHYIPESLATHVISDESATRSKNVTRLLRFEISQAEMMLYLCGKYHLPQHMREAHEWFWCNASLRLALRERDPDLANEVYARARKFSAPEWFRYWGAKYSVAHYAYRVTSRLLQIVRKQRSHWS